MIGGFDIFNYKIMTGAEIYTKFINMVDDELDTDYTYQLMNDARDEIESQVDWEILKNKTTITSASTSLPTNFVSDILLTDGSSRYIKINKEDSDIYNYNAYSYYLDLANNKLEIINYNSQTLYFYYIKSSTEISSDTEWIFPSRFHSILAYKMAQMYYASDAGEKSRSWDDRWNIYFKTKFDQMLNWDTRLKTLNRRPLRYGQSPTQTPV